MDKTARARWMVVAVLAVAGLSVGFISLAWSSSVALASSEEEPEAETRLINGIKYPVNENGQTYGDVGFEGEGTKTWASLEASPDLVRVSLSDTDEVGYVEKGVTGTLADPDDPILQQDARYPIYESDGETQIGWWIRKGGAEYGVSLDGGDVELDVSQHDAGASAELLTEE